MFAASQALRYLSARLRVAGNERGATAVEYGIMVALIAVAIIVTVTALGGELSGLFGDVGETIGAVEGAGGGGTD